MPPVLQKDETLTAHVDVHATPAQLHALISDVARFPEWSPEVVRVRQIEAIAESNTATSNTAASNTAASNTEENQ